VSQKKLILLLVLLFPSVLYIVLTTGKHNLIYPAYFGPKDVQKTMVNGKEKVDTIYHSIPPFSFTNQYGKIITEKDYAGKIYVANFFFTTCKSICPKMSTQMERIQEKFATYKNVLFLSHTVDPQNDTTEALAAYANLVHADGSKWNFVRGEEKDIYEIATSGYLVPAGENTEPGGEAFIHSELFILVDGNRHIRGIYDGTSTVEVNKLMDAIKSLLSEALAKEKE
jgi:protein SCO1